MKVKWNIRKEGRQWSGEECKERWPLTPEKIEVIQGKLLWSEEERINLLGMLLENVGIGKAVSLGDIQEWYDAVNTVMKKRNSEIPDELLKEGIEVFKSEENFFEWMNDRCMVLGGVTPISLIKSDEGKQKVLDIIGRIKYGVYS